MKLSLTKQQAWNHFFPTLFFGLLLLVVVGTSGYYLFENRNDLGAANWNVTVIYVLVFLGLAIWSFLEQSRALEFREEVTSRSAEENYRVILDAVNEQPDWRIESQIASQRLLIRTAWSVASWGEMITIFFLGNTVYINSIHATDTFFIAATHRKNWRNLDYLADQLKNA